ncbi:RagB/SusD family nutrient uptake outer membrane protein [Polaribacter sp. R2A056_3_33]|uniref:RagB/SusD family nutrient uptake outer membrane protein n=1 Tax=Polaribacter sp. R2A056_3_33 TaxID=2745563 RepID=UPI001C4FC122|nr:RagB/SusD family nutrient uptake outer membrane protein [Polaribacter sp. R2A056_3_33]QXP69778.1 RagB/SusD family nutrient uptake outer membrane protein [Polaribacter sp. R2A056_3_33]
MKKIIYSIFITLSFISCDKYLDIEPVGQVIPKSVEEYRSFLTSAYSITKESKVLTTYRTDELALSADALGVEQYEDLFIWNDVNPSPLTSVFPYASLYNTIFYTNHVINSEATIEGNQSDKEQLVGEAYALRAMQYFELINLYAKPYNKSTANTDAGVPITLEYDAEKEFLVQTVEDVYALILSDLTMAESLINIQKQEAGYNYRFSMIAVKAFKSRVYLYQQEWQKAIDLANEALAINAEIQNLNIDTSIMPSEYNAVESILALETVASFDLVNNTTISKTLIDAYNQTADVRFSLYFKENTDGSFSSNKSAETKFKVSYRTAELHLTIAECLAALNEDVLAKEKLISFAENRYTTDGFIAYKANVNSLNSNDLKAEILEERRREFAIEGQRWNDLRRTNQPKLTKIFDGVIYTLENNDDRYVIPFPNDATINNPNL